MAILNPGTSSVSATTYEGALLELLTQYRVNRKASPVSTITVNIQNNAESVFVSAVLPVAVTVTDSGTVTTTVIDESHDDFTWVADPTSDIKAPSIAAQIFALASKIQLGTPVTTDSIDRVTLNVNTDAGTATLNTNFVMILAPGSGLPLGFNVAPYIADL